MTLLVSVREYDHVYFVQLHEFVSNSNIISLSIESRLFITIGNYDYYFIYKFDIRPVVVRNVIFSSEVNIYQFLFQSSLRVTNSIIKREVDADSLSTSSSTSVVKEEFVPKDVQLIRGTKRVLYILHFVINTFKTDCIVTYIHLGTLILFTVLTQQ